MKLTNSQRRKIRKMRIKAINRQGANAGQFNELSSRMSSASVAVDVVRTNTGIYAR